MTLSDAKRFIALCLDPGTFEALEEAFPGLGRRGISNVKGGLARRLRAVGIDLPPLVSLGGDRARGNAGPRVSDAELRQLADWVEHCRKQKEINEAEARRRAEIDAGALLAAKYRKRAAQPLSH